MNPKNFTFDIFMAHEDKLLRILTITKLSNLSNKMYGSPKLTLMHLVKNENYAFYQTKISSFIMTHTL